jgi:hypothetical protein
MSQLAANISTSWNIAERLNEDAAMQRPLQIRLHFDASITEAFGGSIRRSLKGN